LKLNIKEIKLKLLGFYFLNIQIRVFSLAVLKFLIYTLFPLIIQILNIHIKIKTFFLKKTRGHGNVQLTLK